jgi:hypothetical protein
VNTDIEEVKNTLKVAEAAALRGLIPVSNQSGVKITPPPNPTKPPRNPANILAFTVYENTVLILPSGN